MSVRADTAVGTGKTSHRGEEEWQGEGRRQGGKERMALEVGVRDFVVPGRF